MVQFAQGSGLQSRWPPSSHDAFAGGFGALGVPPYLSPPMPEAPAADPIEPHVWRITGVVILGMVMSILDTTIVNVALDTLGRDLHSPISQIQWVITGYLLALAAVIPITGWAARRFGSKHVYLGSIAVFTLGSALCGLATSTTSLVLFRVLQGLGGGMIMPVAWMIMAEVAGPKRMGRVMGVVVMPAMLAPILGPVVGGLILQGLHWSWIFFVNVPIGIVAFLLAIRMLPASDLGEPGRLDVLGLALLAVSMPLTVYGLAEIGTLGSFTAPSVILPILVGLALSAAFAWHALRVERPLLDVRLYANRVFGAASLTTFGLGAALFGAMILVPLYYQQVRGESVIVTGLLVGPQGLGMLAVGPFNGRLTERFGAARVAVAGVSILCVSTIPLGLIGTDTSILAISLVLALRGLGIGLSFMPTMTAAFAALRTDQLSDATPQMNVLQRLGGAIGTAVLAVVLQRAAAGAHSPAALASAFDTAYWWSLGIAALSLIPCVVLLRAEASKHKATHAETIAESGVEPLGT
jgi:EmrB/QacA subfamily drug resistance transporter